MVKISSNELRKKWLDFYKSKGHCDIGAVSLIGDGETGVMFNVAGMQSLMPYLLGIKEHEKGKRLCNVQGCVRTVDIDNIGDETHLTFFEMMGNWSLGDYFKKEKVKWSYELLTDVFGLDGNKICATVFAGNEKIPRDLETGKLLEEQGIKKENIYYLKDNWWNLEGTSGTPCGPDNEWFYPKHDKKCCETCDINCSCGRYVEIGNDVYMQYVQYENNYKELKQKNVDTGFGFERNLAFLNGITDCYLTDLFIDSINSIEKNCNKRYQSDEETKRAMRIICDHIRTSIMLIGDVKGIKPSNTGAGYVLRRLLRRAYRYIINLGGNIKLIYDLINNFVNVYEEAYPNLKIKQKLIEEEIINEINKFQKTLDLGIKEFEKLINNLKTYTPKNKTIAGQKAFRLFDTFGFPVELTCELAKEQGFEVDINGFKKAFENHQELSRTASAGAFKGGLAEKNIETTKLHTATHLLLSALKKVLNDESIHQCGSNITAERLRFDFNFNRKLTDEEILKIENEVNKNIKASINVVCEEMKLEDAKNSGAVGIFENKYGDKVTVYTIGNVSKEICGGPHVNNTKELGIFKITKEESSSSGVRRIKAILN